MPGISYPLINGNRFDFSSVRFMINGTVYEGGVKEVSYSQSLTPGELRGNHAQLIGRTRGKYECEASLTMFKEEYDQLVSDIGPGYMEVAFDLQVSYSELGSGIVLDVITGCRIKKDEDTGTEGGDPSMVKIDLHPMYVIRNGIAPMNPDVMLPSGL